MKIIIAGCRDFNDFKMLEEFCDKMIKLNALKDIEIVSGNARGADQLGERYAIAKGYNLKLFPANWNQFGKSAGYIRNEQMAKYGDMLIAFWDNISKGTGHMINLAKKHDLHIMIHNFLTYESRKINW